MLSRRALLRMFGALGLGAACTPLPEDVDHPGKFDGLDPEDYAYDPIEDRTAADANIVAAMATLLPTRRDGDRVLVPGAVEVDALDMLSLDNFVPTARSQGLLPDLPAEFARSPESFDESVRAVLSADLDALAFAQRPFTAFRRLDERLRGVALDEGFADPLRAPGLRFIRAACFLAWLGAGPSKLGLYALGYPTFEDAPNGVAVRGYPRTVDGRLVDAATEDLAALEAAGVLDDYTYNRAPTPTTGEDLRTLVDANGDLL